MTPSLQEAKIQLLENPEKTARYDKIINELCHFYKVSLIKTGLMFHKYHLLNQLQVFMRYKKITEMSFNIPLSNQEIKVSLHFFGKATLMILVEDQLSPNCTLLVRARKFSDHFLQTAIINGDKADSKILHLYSTADSIH